MWENQPSTRPGPVCLSSPRSYSPPLLDNSRSVLELGNAADVLWIDVLYELIQKGENFKTNEESSNKAGDYNDLRPHTQWSERSSGSKSLSFVTHLSFGATRQLLPTRTAAVHRGREVGWPLLSRYHARYFINMISLRTPLCEAGPIIPFQRRNSSPRQMASFLAQARSALCGRKLVLVAGLLSPRVSWVPAGWHPWGSGGVWGQARGAKLAGSPSTLLQGRGQQRPCPLCVPRASGLSAEPLRVPPPAR